ncbi:MAG: DNA methyltransferase [Solirubrobacteraceae bacterium]
MALTAELIRQNLVAFGEKWSLYQGSERAEAQTFLNELFACYGQDRQAVGARFEEAQHGKFLDLLWSGICLIEMKRPSEAGKLAAHRQQALDYWRQAADAARNVPAPEWVVLCAFHRFEIWQPGKYPGEPRATFDLVELPDQLDTLLFLAGREPVFVGTQAAVTRETAALVTRLYTRLVDRAAADLDELRDFLLQCVWCLFAEDLGQLEGHLFTRLLDELVANPSRSSADELGALFEWLNKPGPRPPGLYRDTRYVNGGLFNRPTHVHLDREELHGLRYAAASDWRKVEPHIFGSLLEGALGHEAQWARGAHYTHEIDIRKVVRPTIVEPWSARIEAADSLAEVQRLQQEMLDYVVLDPACGSGNFLYVAYRELRRLERRLHERERELRDAGGLKGKAEQGALSAFFPLHNMRGIEIDAFAVSLARVTLWMAHKLAVDELDLSEATLPLEDLSGIQVGDALRVPWPKASVIIGNPPFHGDRNLRALLGDDYVEWLKVAFGCGVKDHCVYWFRKAHDHLGPGRRAGLVGTNSISQNRARGASLNYIAENGGVITDAVSKQDWPGAAVVNVSIVNWIKGGTADSFLLDGLPVEGVDTALTDSTIPVADVPVIAANKGRAFQGFLPGAKFDLEPHEAERLLRRGDAPYAEVVLPYMDGRDLVRTVDQSASRFTIDFGQRPLEDAARYPAALDVVRQQAKESREQSTSYARNPRWWQFLWPRPEFRSKVPGLGRFLAGTRVAKRIFFVWCEPHWRPSDATNMFALAEDYHFAVLTSGVHGAWAKARSSTLRKDIRYTPSSAFETFPWPPSSAERRAAIGDLGRELDELRGTLCAEHSVGLQKLYDMLDDGAFEQLAKLHRQLDAEIVDAYGWPKSAAVDVRDRNRRLYDLNADIVAGRREYSPF